MQIGIMFWAGRDNPASIAAFGVHHGQLGIGGDFELSPQAAADYRALLARVEIAPTTVMVAFNGEDYADIPTVQRTVGFIPQATRAEREQRTLAVSDFAAALGVPGIGCHIGFVPEDKSDPDYAGVRDLVRRICDHAATHNQTLALETGQEPAHALLDFFKDVNRPNLGINFDPANMILYGTGDPIEALDLLGPHVISVHCKDGDWPPKDKPGALGTERPLGQGSVGIERFLAKLKEIGYRGPLSIERETHDQEARLRDIEMAVELLRSLTGGAA